MCLGRMSSLLPQLYNNAVWDSAKGVGMLVGRVGSHQASFGATQTRALPSARCR